MNYYGPALIIAGALIAHAYIMPLPPRFQFMKEDGRGEGWVIRGNMYSGDLQRGCIYYVEDCQWSKAGGTVLNEPLPYLHKEESNAAKE
jgi:hypothetical protein